MSVQYASGKRKAGTKLIRQDNYPPALDAEIAEGSWVIGPDGDMFYSDGVEWVPSVTRGVEVIIPPWVDVPNGWFEVFGSLQGDLSNRTVIANKFDLNYVLGDVRTWPIINPAVMYTDSAGTIPVISAPESVGLLEDSTMPQYNWYQDVTASRPVWKQLTRKGETVNYLEFDLLGQEMKVDFDVPTTGTMLHITSNGIYTATVSIPSGVFNFGRWQLWPIEELIVLDRSLTSGEATQLIAEIVRTRNRVGVPNFGTNWDNAFRDRSELVSIPTYDTSAVTNFSFTWDGCSSLTSFPPIDTSSGTDFTYTWRSCTSLTSFPLIDTSSGTNFLRAWQNCSSLTSFPLIDTSSGSGTTFYETWSGCTSLTSFPLINTSSGTTFFETWQNCSGLTSFPLIDTSSGTNFTYSWRNCSSLTSFPLIDTSSGTNFSVTWDGCSSLTSFPLINTSSGTVFAYAWRNCSSLTSFPLIDTSGGTSFLSTWSACSSLTSFPLIDTSSGTNFESAWINCSSLTSFPAISTSSGTNFFNAWSTCSSLTSFPLIGISSGTNFGFTWNNCTSLQDFPAGFFDSWTGTPATNCFQGTWRNCTSLTPTSVVNILTSLDTSGRSAPASGVVIEIVYAGGDISAASTAITNLKSRGWTVTINGVAQ